MTKDSPRAATESRGPAAPSPDEVAATLARLAPHILATPLVPWAGPELPAHLAPGTKVSVKLELLQRTGSFKARGALNVLQSLSPEARAKGVTAISAGNHAIAVAWAAAIAGASAKVVMPRTANPYRVAMCRRHGAEVVLAENVTEAFRLVEEIAGNEGRTFVHPFEGPLTAAGTATIGLEILRDLPGAGAILVPVGGGGLIAGIASFVKQTRPDCLVLGIEPEGARGMSDSLAAGAPADKVSVATIADSLGAPLHKPYSFGLVRRFVDDMVTVSDQAMIDGMALYLRDMKLAVEPAPAAALAALIGPWRERLAGKNIVLIGCGANIDEATYLGHLAKARPSSEARAT